MYGVSSPATFMSGVISATELSVVHVVKIALSEGVHMNYMCMYTYVCVGVGVRCVHSRRILIPSCV